MQTFYAHIREDGDKQTVAEHLRGTAEKSGAEAPHFSEKDIAYISTHALKRQNQYNPFQLNSQMFI